MWRRILRAFARAAVCASVCAALLLASLAFGDGQRPEAETAGELSESYAVNTTLQRMTFPAKPRIDIYNYLVGDCVCRLVKYDLQRGDSRCMLLSLTLTNELRDRLIDADMETRQSLMRMCLDMVEAFGFVLNAGDYDALYGNAVQPLAAFNDELSLSGWAAMSPAQLNVLLATSDDDGYDFLASVYTNTTLEFEQSGDALRYAGANLTFYFPVEVHGGRAVAQSGASLATAELIQLPDLPLIAGIDSGDAYSLLLSAVPENAQEITMVNLGGTPTLTYYYENDEGRPLQGRVALTLPCALRAEATLDNPGDAYMNDFYIE